MKNTLIHIGYPKTGSTWLQQEVFSNPALGMVPYTSNSRSLLVSEFLLVDGYRFDPRAARQRFDEAAERQSVDAPVAVLSDETLCGNPLARRYTGKEVADRLHDVFPEAHILITIREQRSIALSLYREYIRGDNGTVSLKSFIGTGHEADGYSPILMPEYLSYDKPVEYYRRLFGDDRVFVLPQEVMKSDQSRALSDLCKFLGINPGSDSEFESKSANVGHLALTLVLKRMVNRLFPLDPLKGNHSRTARVLQKLFRGVDLVIPRSLSKPLEQSWRKTIHDRYAGLFDGSNRRLQLMVTYDLAELGYPIEASA